MSTDAPSDYKVGPGKPPREHCFKPGVSPNPGGKPKASRNKLQGDFMRALANDFERYGMRAIARVRRYDPSAYVKVCASLMPKELEVTQPLDDISDAQLDAAVAAVRAILAAQGPGIGPAAQEVSQPAGGVPALPKTA